MIQVGPGRETGFSMTNLSIRMPGAAELADPLLVNLSISLLPGQNLLIRGPNGCGKSSLLKTLAGILSPASGEFTIPPFPHTLFVPQTSYLPFVGNMADVMEYGCMCIGWHPHPAWVIEHSFNMKSWNA